MYITYHTCVYCIFSSFFLDPNQTALEFTNLTVPFSYTHFVYGE